MQARTMISMTTNGLFLQIFMSTLVTFIVANPTTTAATVLHTTSQGIPRETVRVSLPPVDSEGQISFTRTNSENKLSILAERAQTKSEMYPSSATSHYSSVGNTAQLQMNKYNFRVSQNLGNLTDNYLLNDRAVLFDRDLGQLNTSGLLTFPQLFRAFLHGGATPDRYTFSYQCGQDLAMYNQAWSRNEPWTWSIYDSTGKQTPGLLSGTMTWSGNLEQCLSTHVPYNKLGHDGSHVEVQTRFCSVFMTPPAWLSERVRRFKIAFPVVAPSLIIDVCTLSGCSVDDLHQLFQKYVNENSGWENLTITKVRCYKDKKLWDDVPAIVSLCVIFLLILLALAGTLFEIFIRASRSGVKSSLEIHIGLDSIKNPTRTRCTDLNTKHNSFSNNLISDTQISNIGVNPGQTAIQETQNVCSSLDSTMPCSNMEDSLNSSTDFLVGIIEEQDEGEGSSSETKNVCSSLDIAMPCSDMEASLDLVADVGVGIAEEQGQGERSSAEIKNVCSSLDIAMPCSDMEASLDSSTDVGVGIPEEEDQGEGSSTKKAGRAKRVKHRDLILSVDENINTATIRDELLGINKTTNQLSSISTSNYSDKKRADRVSIASIKSAIYNGSMFRKRSLPRMKKRHLQTQLSADVTGTSSPNTVTLLQRILVTFSIRRNLTNIFGKGHEDMLFCVNGIRLLSNSWIVLGSYFMTIYSNPSVAENHVKISKFGQSFWAQFLVNTGLAADTFFIISGALNMYNFMKAKSRSGCKSMLRVMSPAEYGWSVIHRLFRIAPCYYMALMIHSNLSGYLGTGRELRQQADSSGHCSDHWWSHVLFISNFYTADEMCMPWSYYLVNDLQLSLLSPLITIPLLCRPVLGFGLISCLVGLQIVSVLAINTPINGNSMRMNTTSYFPDVYVKPYCRAGVYAMGLGLGYFLYTGEKRVQLRKVPLCVGWLLCLTAVFSLPQFTHMQNQEGGRLWSGFETSLYEALSRPLWGLAVAWIIFTCCNGQGGLISKIMSWNVYIPLARITYAVYVLHPILLEAVLVSTESNIKVNVENMILCFISLLVASWCLAICMILLVEQPFVHIDAAIRNYIQSKKKS